MIKSLKGNRSLIPDLLKGFAVFFMIQVHIMELFIDRSGQESWFGTISLFLGGPFAAPVFMVVMGYFISKSRRTPFEGIVRGLKIFILGLLLNIGLNFHLLTQIIGGGIKLNPMEYIGGVDILFLAGLSIILLSIMKTVIKEKHWIILILILLISLGTPYINEFIDTRKINYILPFIGGHFSWSYFPLFPWLAYPLSGFLFHKWESEIIEYTNKKKLAFRITVLGLFILLMVFFEFGINASVNLKYYYHHHFFFFLWVIGLVILWTLFLQFSVNILSSKVSNFIAWMGMKVTEIYVIQWLIIGNIATSIYQTQEIKTFGFWFALIFTVSILLAFVYEKLKAKSQKGML